MKRWMAMILCVSLVLCPVVQGEGVDITPTDTPSTDQLPTVMGDVNGDGAINAGDALDVLLYAVGRSDPPLTQAQCRAAMVSTDEVINAHDALLILQYAVGKIQRFPAAPDEDLLQDARITLSTFWADQYLTEGEGYTAALNAMNETYGTTTTVNQMSADDLDLQQIANRINAGNEPADWLEVSISMARDLYRMNLLENLSDVPLPEEARFSGATGAVTVGKHRMGVGFNSGYLTMGIFFNKQLMERYAPEYDLYQMYADKTWNFDAFSQVAIACTQDDDSDGKPEVYGFTSNSNAIVMAMGANAGGLVTMRNAKAYPNFASDASFNAIDWMGTLYKAHTYLYKSSVADCLDAFANGRSVMLVTYGGTYMQMEEKVSFEVGFVPMALGEGQQQYYVGETADNVYVIPKGKQANKDLLGAWMTALVPAQQQLLDEMEQQLQDNMVDEKGSAIYREAILSQQGGYLLGAQVSSFEVMMNSDYQYTQEQRERIRQAAQKELDEYYGAFYSVS